MNTQSCSIYDREETAARYVADRLNDTEREEFELHFLCCSECRDAIREATEIRSGLRSARQRRKRRALLGPAGLAAAAVSWILLAPTSTERLGHVDAPRADLMDIRAVEDSSALAADRGMAAYKREDYRDAAQNLAKAYARHIDDGTAFYLGLSLLLSGNPDSAITVFRAIEHGSPYAFDARYYTAKAFLRSNEADSARRELVSADARTRALLDSIQRLR